MKQNTILLPLFAIILCIVVYTFAIRVSKKEHFDETAHHSHRPTRAKFNFGLYGLFSKRKCIDARSVNTLERTYNICNKALDENQGFNIWDIPWISRDASKDKLKDLWDNLRKAFPNN